MEAFQSAFSMLAMAAATHSRFLHSQAIQPTGGCKFSHDLKSLLDVKPKHLAGLSSNPAYVRPEAHDSCVISSVSEVQTVFLRTGRRPLRF